MNLKQRIPFLRWSVWRLAVGARNITTTGQIGDGREAGAVGPHGQCARGCAPAQTSRSACTVTSV